MSKASKACAYTGHLRSTNRTNTNKEIYETQQARMHPIDPSHGADIHPKHKVAYPEEQQRCSCKK